MLVTSQAGRRSMHAGVSVCHLESVVVVVRSSVLGDHVSTWQDWGRRSVTLAWCSL